ncbi:MAG: EAL domain-containing protein [Rhodospirillales bacterium]|nr:EAL domain-containing protein [Rhodospirillales bacterium]
MALANNQNKQSGANDVITDDLTNTALHSLPYPVMFIHAALIDEEVSSDLVATALNTAAHEAFSIDPQHADTINLSSLIIEDGKNELLQTLSIVLKKNSPKSGEFSFETKHGSTPYNILAVPHESLSSHKSIILILRPGSSEELRLAVDGAAEQHREDAREATKELLAQISHDIRTPLNTIIGFAQMIEEEMLGPVGTLQYREYATMIGRSGRGLLDQFDEQTSRERLTGLNDHEDYEHIIELAPDMICICRDGKITKINAAGVAMLGMWDSKELEGRAFIDFIHEDYKPIADNNMAEMINERQMLPLKLIKNDGRDIDAELNVLPYKTSDDDTDNGVILTARDMTERQRALRKTIDREEQIRKTMDTVADGIVIIDSSGNIETINTSGEDIFEHKPGSLIGSKFNALLGHTSSSETEASMAQVVGDDGKPLSMNTLYELNGYRKDKSEPFPLEITLNELSLGTRKLLIGSFRDISDRKLQEQKLIDLATRDPLTGMPNRYMFEQCINNAITRADHSGESFAIMNIDLNNFKNINEALGHVFGDKLLVAVGARLKEILKDATMVCHMGSDDFYVLIENNPDIYTLETMAGFICNEITRPLAVEEKEIFTSCTIGICLYPDNAKDRVELMQHTDAAIYNAKSTDSGGFVFFADHLSKQAERRLDIERNLRRAIERDELHLLYQPKVDLKSRKIIGCEALVRWECNELGSVFPDEFIEIAERSGIIIDIGQWVLDEACRQASQWVETSLPDIKVAVNLSAVQFQQGDLEKRILKTLNETGYPPSQLDVELTESMLIENPEHTIETLKSIKSHGITVSMDDFGTGYSSLSYLARFPLDNLKVDRSFVMNLPDDKDAAGLVRAIITMAKQLGMSLIAEGIETESQETFLNALGCEMGQGYFFGKPLTPEDFEALAIKSLN